MEYKTLIAHISKWLHLKNKVSLDDTLASWVQSSPALLSDNQLEEHGTVLAQSHQLTQKYQRGKLREILAYSEAVLIQAKQVLTEAITLNTPFTPADEWLIDNFHLIEEHIRILKSCILKNYEKGLPQLPNGLPRVYEIVREMITHSDGGWNKEKLTHFVSTYQQITPLMLGELWAIPIMLRIALLENLSRVSAQIALDRRQRVLAASWGKKMMAAGAIDQNKLMLVIADMKNSLLSMPSVFVAELVRRLQNSALKPPITEIEQQLAKPEHTIEECILSENKKEAINKLTISHSIKGLRDISEVDWREFIEALSIVEQVLSQDSTYTDMDFTTRDRYRHVIEGLARVSLRSESDAAHLAIQLATTTQKSVGVYLIGPGLPTLQKSLRIQPSLRVRLYQWTSKHALIGYLSLIVLIVIVITNYLLKKASEQTGHTFWLWVLGVVIVIASSQLASTLVNWVITLLIRPQLLPKMDFKKGIPATYRTLVVVPALLGSRVEIESLVESLEVRFLGNRDSHLHFALLTDFNDAPHEHMPEDAELLTLAQQNIIALNKLYRRKNEDIFFLLHRPRKWNVTEQLWIGYERKRGKLRDLNALLRENVQTNFSLIVGHAAILNQIKYVITLDSDTQLPRDAARKLIGTMAHPLNQPCYDTESQRVISGYGILQPRIAEGLSDNPTRYRSLCGSELGIDPYTQTVSDVYQDLFSEGSFVGKGIYDVDVFQQVLAKRFPENLILSHDLLEGCYLRSGFLSDVPLYENSPNSYLADCKRRIRWIRGDWQLISWLLPRVLNSVDNYVMNPLSGLSKWKLFDNLRRSLVSFSLIILLCLSWTLLPPTVFWLISILAFLLLPGVLMTLLEVASKPTDILLRQHMASMVQVAHRRFDQLVLYLACLPHEAWYSLEAILRTGWRLMISHRNLLEWIPSDRFEPRFKNTQRAWIAQMWMGPALTVVIVLILAINHRFESLLLAAPLLFLWLISPWLARWVSQPLQRAEVNLDLIQRRFLHKMARKTWDYFVTFVTADDHWLPPDNYQEKPVEVLCHRTSPTNMGLALLANLTAYDFGYLTCHELLERSANTLKTMNALEKYHGHFYNWYNTQTLAPLSPRYISTVDGGNLSGHLLALRQGLLALVDDPLLNSHYLNGLEDTLDVLTEMVPIAQTSRLNDFRQSLQNARAIFGTWRDALSSCDSLCATAEKISTYEWQNNKALTEIHEWSQKLLQQCQALREELMLFSEISSKLDSSTTLREIAISSNQPSVQARMNLITALAEQVFSLAQMDVSFLYNETTHLMTIGFNVDTQVRDRSEYDLLSSEARLAYFVAIAQGQIPQESWFALGRLQVLSKRGQPLMISWGGSMFEYLMPLLVMPCYQGTLLEQMCQAAVSRHIDYGKQRGVPWGISESAFHAVDASSQYLYQTFGVPELGLKPGLGKDLVVAPYATVMALMITPESACLNLQRLASRGASGRFGFYEAIDFTARRLLGARSSILVRSFMVHHQAMSLLAFSYLLNDQPMQKRFASDPLFQSALLLLQERIPRLVATYFQPPVSQNQPVMNHEKEVIRTFNNPNTSLPQVQLLSNGHYHVMLTQAGSGYSRWKEIVLTRWREDSTCDNRGLFSYVRDVETGDFWSTSYQPTTGNVDNFKAIFAESQVEFCRLEHEIATETKIVVSPEDDVELRRFRISNRSQRSRTIEFTSYAEVVLASQADDQSQPAFNNLFIETELLQRHNAIVVTRRPASSEQNSPWMGHMLNVYSATPHAISFETNRTHFIGRSRTPATPEAMILPGDLSNTAGTVLDPIVAIRCRITLEPDAYVTYDLITGITDTRDHCLALIEKYHDRHLANRIFDLSATYSKVLLHQLTISPANARLYNKLAGAVIYANGNYRAEPSILARNRYGQQNLWGYSISGDLPIVLLQIEDIKNIKIVKQLLQAQAYWRRKGLDVDVVILNESNPENKEVLQKKLLSFLNPCATADHNGSVFVPVTEMPPADRILLQSVARVVLSDKRGSLNQQLKSRAELLPAMNLIAIPISPFSPVMESLTVPSDLRFFNGLGGFTADGDEYMITLRQGSTTPAPWVNVLANPNFGTLVSECGQAYTWLDNAHEFRLTPWDNDPVQDASGEAFYLRDDETNDYWSAAPLPARGKGDYRTRHGFGYSVFEHKEKEIHSELWMYVALDAPVKFSVLKIRNDSARTRQLSITGYVEWVLGDLRAKNLLHVITELSSTGVLLAQNHYNTEFGDRTAFFAAEMQGLHTRSVTGSREEFLGRNGSKQTPAALQCLSLSGQVGAGLDPCGAIQLSFDLAQGQSREIVFTLGGGQNNQETLALAQHYLSSAAATEALQTVRQHWRRTLKAVRVSTPDPALDLLVNGWLVYQVLASRLWGRSGYYQSGGAFGFRDQLQDVMSLVHASPESFRKQLLLCASRQFTEGDVQHWWHPPQGRGVRTRCSDDYLWLPFAICRYVETTGDEEILNEQVAFLQGRLLKPGEQSYYELPSISSERSSLYVHGTRAILHGLQFGAHGLPLMGSGDWNDGMNLVGKEGKGESIWLGFFLYTVLKRFALLAHRYGDAPFAERCEKESTQLQKNLEQHGWDGKWYRRAYFDDGTPLGSASNKECRIDSIAQSWSVLSTAAEKTRAEQAMMSLNHYLVRREDKLVTLLDPPFNRSIPSPGYIEGYVPGIRENGGQYTHGAIWAVMAFAALADYSLAWELFNLINPINHGRTAAEIDIYKIEPYVMAGDVYSVAPHVGNGGWSWYTGSAGWTYRLITESLLGLQLEEGKQLRFTPHMPIDWESFTLDYHYKETLYQFMIKRSTARESMTLDGIELEDNYISLLDDGKPHQVQVYLKTIG
jgi:cyclic beta-1,2-glucan synthetase